MKARKLIAMLLVVATLMSFAPMAVFAADGTFVVEVRYVAKGGPLNGQTVATSWSGSFAEGSAYSNTITLPTVEGYIAQAPTEVENVTTTLTGGQLYFSFENLDGPKTITVNYVPAEVGLTVEYYQQNVDNDEYTLEASVRIPEAKTGDPISDYVSYENATGIKVYDGFYALWFDSSAAVAADGNTLVQVRYDRDYYLMTFDLNGGYGVEPIYARYGAPISVGTPTRAGYEFAGWEPELTHTTMPDENTTYKATWTAKDTTYDVVFWYENANNTEYAQAGVLQDQTAKSGTIVDGSSYANTSFTGRDATHFTYDHADEDVEIKGDGSTVINVYFKRNVYTLTFRGDSLTCTKEAHSHTYDSSYSTGIIFGTRYYIGGCYPDGDANAETGGATAGNEICGKTAHTHGSSCYTEAVVKTITAKYQADIQAHWPIKNDSGFDGTGYWWDDVNNTVFDNYTVSLDSMPGANITFSGEYKGDDAKIYYYLENLAGDTSGRAYDNKYYKLYKTVITVDSGYLTREEEFHDIPGFTQGSYTPDGIFSSGTGVQPENYLYYTRNSYNLQFSNMGTIVSGKGGVVQYEAPLKPYEFTPDYPANQEANALVFEGWYTSPYFGDTKVDFATDTMPLPAGDTVTLYARWVPKQHKVNVYLTDAMTAEQKIGETQTVDHNAAAKAPAEDPENTGLTFVGWFYKDGETEKAFDFSMPIKKDMDIYAKWKATTPVNYTVKFQLADGTPVADPIVGKALPFTNVTAVAKIGDELYAADDANNSAKKNFQNGYFPNFASQALDMTVDAAKNVIIFVYTAKTDVPYTVKYLLGDTEIPMSDVTDEDKYANKTVSENKMSVVTENALIIPGYLADAPQKRLILTSDSAKNVLVFRYTENKTQAYIQETHYLLDENGKMDATYRDLTELGTIGNTYSKSALPFTNYVLTKVTVNDVEWTAEGNPSAELTNAGLHFEFYYIPNKFYVHHQSDKSVVAYELTAETETFDITKVVYSNYLYGGLYESSFTTPYSTEDLTADNSPYVNKPADGKNLKPVAGEHYYVKEVDDRYARPGVYLVWDTREENNLAMHKLYLMTAIDNNQYLEVGIELDYDDDTKDVEHAVTSADSKLATDGANTKPETNNFKALHKQFMAQFSEKNYTGVRTDTVTAVSGFFSKASDEEKAKAGAADAYLYVYDFSAFVKNPEQVRYSCFFVTPDGIRVEGVKYRDLYQDSTDSVDALTYTNFVRTASGEIPSVCTDKYPAPDTASVMSYAPLMMRSVYTISGDIEDTYTITKIDGENVETQEVEEGDWTGAVTYTEKEGYIFAGWYTDKACTAAADFSDVQSDMTVYAKYISAKHVNVKTTALSKFMNATITTNGSDMPAIGLNYTLDGDTTEVTCKQYNGILSAISKLLGSKSKTYTASWNMSQLTNGDTFTVTCYWVTEDGTTVEIETSTYAYNRNRISEQ